MQKVADYYFRDYGLESAYLIGIQLIGQIEYNPIVLAWGCILLVASGFWMLYN